MVGVFIGAMFIGAMFIGDVLVSAMFVGAVWVPQDEVSAVPAPHVMRLVSVRRGQCVAAVSTVLAAMFASERAFASCHARVGVRSTFGYPVAARCRARDHRVRHVKRFGYSRAGRNAARVQDAGKLGCASRALFVLEQCDVLCRGARFASVRPSPRTRVEKQGINDRNHSLILSTATPPTQKIAQEIAKSYVISSIGEFIQKDG